MSVSSAIRKMVDAGFTPEQALKAAEIFEAETVRRDSVRSEQNRRAYLKRKAAETPLKSAESQRAESQQFQHAETLKSAESQQSLARVEDNLPTKDMSGKKEKEHRTKSAPRDAFVGCLSPSIADAVIEHRLKIRKPLTHHAAVLLAAAFAATGHADAAADMMIARGWQGFRPDWFTQESSGHGRNGKSVHEAVRRLEDHVAAGGTLDELFDLGCDEGRKKPVGLLPEGRRSGTGNLRLVGSSSPLEIPPEDRSRGH